jgi:hypothetical protein
MGVASGLLNKAEVVPEKQDVWESIGLYTVVPGRLNSES